jgi:hypothetical protein
MSMVDHAGAALSAGRRATECRARLQQLQSRVPMTGSDVEQANAALHAARVRALAASIRAGTRRAATQTEAGFRPDLVHVDDRMATLRAMAESGTVSLAQLSVAYLGLGGSCSSFEVDAFVHGVMRLPRIETILLEQALSELD